MRTISLVTSGKTAAPNYYAIIDLCELCIYFLESQCDQDNSRKTGAMARSNFSYEKRRKELEKKKKKEAKRQAKADRKAAMEAGETVAEPVITLDEFGNVVEILPEVDPEAQDEADDSPADDTDPD